MRATLNGLRWCAVVFGLAGCGTAATKEPATPASKAGEGEGETKFKADAMKASATLVGLWAITPPEASDEPPTGWHRHAATGTCMPTGSKNWQLRVEKVFGPDDEGVSLWNDQLKTLVSLFTYPAQAEVDAEMEQVVKEMTGTCTEGPLISTTSGETRYAACLKRMEDDFLLVEQVSLVKRDKWLYKVRATFPSPVLMQVYAPTMAFVGQAFQACK
ncbi:MAG TPA: hypothetical protein VHP33_28675 [Polyangiaceae bacterium]|nr:hypothetical protein [Polyangiaceae bacterium]